MNGLILLYKNWKKSITITEMMNFYYGTDFLLAHSVQIYSDPFNSFNCLGHFKNVYDDNDDMIMGKARIPRRQHRHRHGHPREDPRRHVRHARLKLFLWQAERHADILATILARMSVSVSTSWNATFNNKKHLKNVGLIRHCSNFTLPFTTCRYCRHHYQDEPKPAIAQAECKIDVHITTTTTTTRDRGDRYGPIE